MFDLRRKEETAMAIFNRTAKDYLKDFLPFPSENIGNANNTCNLYLWAKIIS